MIFKQARLRCAYFYLYYTQILDILNECDATIFYFLFIFIYGKHFNNQIPQSQFEKMEIQLLV